jgi:endonuclease-3 related protein
MSNTGEYITVLPVPELGARREWPQNPDLRQKVANSKRSEAQPPLDQYFNSLFTALGPQHWWPGKTQFEVIIRAILTQNTSWQNVELALSHLRTAGVFTPTAVEKANVRRLQSLIRPSGYYRQKARALKSFVRFLRTEYRGSLKRMFATRTVELREKLLRVWGIGPETADAILLYAGEHPVFVVDAYTKRIMSRHGWIGDKAKYEELRWMFERQFPGQTERFKEFHGLIVAAGKNWCRKQVAKCEECPLGRYLEEGR